MRIYRAYKVELDPNNKQKSALSNHAGAARWAYNWGLSQKIKSYKETGKTVFAIALHKELNKLKKLPLEEGGVPWMYEVSKCAPQEAFRILDKNFRDFYRRFTLCKEKSGFPKFKVKKEGEGSFALNGAIHVLNSRIKLPRLGSIKLKEKGYLPIDGTKGISVYSATISEKLGRWYVSLRVVQDLPDPLPVKEKYVVGVDVGIKELAVTSDGEVFENPKAFNKEQKHFRMLNKALSRKKEGSKNWRKAKKKLATLHKKVRNSRRDNQHKASTTIVKSADVIVVESLNVKEMLKNRALTGAVRDSGMSEFLRQLEYKAKWAGKKVIEANRWYPSSKTCSNCGSVKAELGLDERTFNCAGCGISIDRDLNAAINLKNLAGSSPVSACCPGVSTSDRIVQGQALVGQEPNTSLEG